MLEIIAEFKDGGFKSLRCREGVIEDGFGAKALAVRLLESREFGGFGRVRVSREGFFDKQEPDFFASVVGIECFILGVACAAEVGVGGWGFCAVAVADELDESGAGVDFALEHLAEVAVFGTEDV